MQIKGKKIKLARFSRHKKLLIIIALILLLSTGSTIVEGIAEYRRGVNVLKNVHLIFMCPLQKGFNLLPNINPFTKFDCSQDYPGKQKNEKNDDTPVLRRFGGGDEFCNRFPNAKGCQ